MLLSVIYNIIVYSSTSVIRIHYSSSFSSFSINIIASYNWYKLSMQVYCVYVYLDYSTHSIFLRISLDIHCSGCDSLNVDISCAWKCTNILAVEDMEEDTHKML